MSSPTSSRANARASSARRNPTALISTLAVKPRCRIRTGRRKRRRTQSPSMSQAIYTASRTSRWVPRARRERTRRRTRRRARTRTARTLTPRRKRQRRSRPTMPKRSSMRKRPLRTRSRLPVVEADKRRAAAKRRAGSSAAASVGQQAAPPIGAKLTGISRKIFRVAAPSPKTGPSPLTPPPNPQAKEIETEFKTVHAAATLDAYNSMVQGMSLLVTAQSKASVNLRVTKLKDAIARTKPKLVEIYKDKAPQLISELDREPIVGGQCQAGTGVCLESGDGKGRAVGVADDRSEAPGGCSEAAGQLRDLRAGRGCHRSDDGGIGRHHESLRRRQPVVVHGRVATRMLGRRSMAGTRKSSSRLRARRRRHL